MRIIFASDEQIQQHQQGSPWEHLQHTLQSTINIHFYITTLEASVRVVVVLRRSLLDADSSLYLWLPFYINTPRFLWMYSSLLFLPISKADDAWRFDAADASKPFFIAPLILPLYIDFKWDTLKYNLLFWNLLYYWNLDYITSYDSFQFQCSYPTVVSVPSFYTLRIVFYGMGNRNETKLQIW